MNEKFSSQDYDTIKYNHEAFEAANFDHFKLTKTIAVTETHKETLKEFVNQNPCE